MRTGAPLGTTELPPPPPAKASSRTAGWVVGGIGVAGLGVGAVAGILTLGKKGTVDDNCNAAKRCNPEGYDAAQSGKTSAWSRPPGCGRREASASEPICF